MTFWDFCSPVYDFAQRRNVNYEKWNSLLVDEIEPECTVLEIAGGTGETSIRAAKKATHVICTDLSEKMLKVARKKAKGISNIIFEKADIYNLNYTDKRFDIVVTSQVLHLLDDTQRAIDEIKRVCMKKIILPICLLENVKGIAKFQVGLWRLLGFNPKYTFNQESSISFLEKYGLLIEKTILVDGSMPILIVVCLA